MTSPLNIRNPKAHALASKLADLRRVSITEAVVGALEAELRREQGRIPLSDRLEALADRALTKAGSGRAVDEDERDALWTR
ncbi:transcriptional regulator [Bosea sp. Root483D1]|uniref:type II toxin-antitoxin system VapB family antitoxin n=1 Tax=Bosea sp. Root483D1 TaxID=1736544 RepID=UPI00070EF71C|nr:type II toxin-antitoxin system VapB family antitoxin [Bosea sp. Root483D1]KRE22014.1 transcriptional regulator [Bosea sp. Root483D1]